jgi:hypothetical protein
MATARAQTDIPDIIDSKIEEALERLLHSLNAESKLSEAGARAVERRLLRILSSRLRMQRDFALHPEIDKQQPTYTHGRSPHRFHQAAQAAGRQRRIYLPAFLAGLFIVVAHRVTR